MDRSKVESDWKKRGFSFGVWTDPPGQVWEDYVHDVDELLMLSEGEIEVEIDGKVSCPKPGEELLIPANANHSVRNIGKSTTKWFYGYKTK